MAYPEAAEALADAVSQAAGVEAYDEVLEVGGGRGDNALRLLRHFGASRVLGVNLSPTETDAARRRIETVGLAKQALVLQGDASNLLGVVTPACVDRVVAVDCAYHFLTRSSFLQSGYAALRVGGSLAVADVVIAAGADTLATRAAGWLFGIPRENLRTASELKSDFSAAGFKRISVKDTTDQVFAGFAKYMHTLAEHRSGLDAVAPLFVGLVMGLLARSGVFRYVIVSGVVQRTEAP